MSVGLLGSAGPLIDWTWVTQNGGMILDEVGTHAELTGIAIGLGLAISLPLAVLAWRLHVARTIVFYFAGLLYTIPSVALFVLVQPLTGYFTIATAEVALTGYTLLILVRNIVAGLEAVPADVAESAVALGYGTSRQLFRVYLPLALPSIFAGLRVATVTVVGLVVVTYFMGQGGLGQLIVYGFEQSFYTPIVVGLLLSVLLAAIGDGFFAGLERATVRWSRARG